jgi:ATP-dependent protease Clp ATPase subunit
MYDLPSIDDVKECIVNDETVRAKQRPILVYGHQKVSSG